MLTQLRGTRPDSSLADAQTLVAERYGFRTWADLKAEVERLGATTKTASDGVAEAIAVAFEVGQPQRPLAALERQWAGQAWVLTTDRGRYLARNLFDWIDHSAVEREVTLATAAADAGVQTLRRSVRSMARSLRPSAVPGGGCTRCPRLVPSRPCPRTPVTRRPPGGSSGQCTGWPCRRQSLLGRGLPASVPRSSGGTCTEQRQSGSCHGRTGWPRSSGRSWTSAASSNQAPGPAAGITFLSGHHYAPSAFRITGFDDLAVMTREHAGAIPPRWDLGGALFLWSGGVPGKVNAAAVQALVAGYAEVTPLPSPLDLGMFSSVLYAGTSWLASRIRIALTESDEEQRELANKAAPWLLADPASRGHFQMVLDAIC